MPVCGCAQARIEEIRKSTIISVVMPKVSAEYSVFLLLPLQLCVRRVEQFEGFELF